MPYVFNKIEDQLGGGQQGPQNANIFVDGQSANDRSAQTQAQASDKNTVRGIDSAPGSGGSTGGEAAPQQEAEGTPAGANSAFLDKNKAEGSGLANTLKAKVDQKSADLQKESDDFYAKASGAGKAQDYQFGNIDKALGGDAASMDSLKGRLAATAPKVDSYKSNVDVKVPGLEDIQTDGGLQNYLTQTGGSSYTSGQAGLDAMLLGQNADFVKSRADLLRQQDATSRKQKELEESTSKRAQDQATADFNAGTTALRGQLEGRASGLDQKAAIARAVYNADVGQLAAKGNDAYSLGQSNNALKALIARAHETDPELEQYLSQVKDVNYNDYYHAGNKVDDIGQFYNQADADQFNLIESLLGNAGVIRSAGGALGPRETYDTAGYQGAVETKARALRDAAAKQLAEKEAKDAEVRAAIKADNEKQQAKILADKVAAEQPKVATTAKDKVSGIPDFGSSIRAALEKAGIGKGIQNTLAPGNNNLPLPAPFQSNPTAGGVNFAGINPNKAVDILTHPKKWKL